MKINFRRIYSKIDDWGMSYKSIILFGKIPLLFNSKVHEDGKCENYTSQFKYVLEIDLFLIILSFNWKGRIIKK